MPNRSEFVPLKAPDCEYLQFYSFKVKERTYKLMFDKKKREGKEIARVISDE